MSDLLNYRIKPIWTIEVKDGQSRMPEEDWSRYQKWLLSHSGKWEFIIQKKFKKRSLPQNSWYWAVIIPLLADEMGEEDHNEVHAYLKSKFLSKEKVVSGKDGQWERIRIVGRTSKMDTNAFGEYCERIRAWAAKFYGLNIPDPDPDHNAYPVLIDLD